MRDRHVRQVFLGLILAFPLLIAAVMPTPPGRAVSRGEQIVHVLCVEGIIGTGLFFVGQQRRRFFATFDRGAGATTPARLTISRPNSLPNRKTVSAFHS